MNFLDKPMPRGGAVATALSAMLSALAGGCALGEAGRAGASTSSTSVEQILAHCVDAYRDLRTLQCVGTLRDLRDGRGRLDYVRWDVVRPYHCRFQLGMDLALVVGKDWWMYDPAAGEFRSCRQFSPTPITTAAYLVSRRVPFLIPALLETGERAFGADVRGRHSRWTLRGMAWRGGQPCYVLSQTAAYGATANRLEVWIEQDRSLVWGWTLYVTKGNGEEFVALDCIFDEVIVNGDVPSDRFRLAPPTPIRDPQRNVKLEGEP